MDPAYQQYIQQAAQQFGVDPQMLMAMMMQESGGNPNAVSSAGAQGLMQLMPGTAADLGVTNPMDPQQNIMGGAQYISQMLNMFGGDPRMALGAYNWGPGNMQRQGMANMPQETSNYINSIMQRWQPPAPQPMATSPQAMEPSPTGYMSGGQPYVGPPAGAAAKTLESSYQGTKLAPGAMSAETFNAGVPASGIGSEIGQFFQGPMGLPTLMGVMGTDFQSPESIGANAGSIAGTAAATGIPAIASALGSAAGPVGAVAGGLLGGEIGGLFGDSPEEKAQKEAKKQTEKKQMMAVMSQTAQSLEQSGYDRRKALENIARALAI